MGFTSQFRAALNGNKSISFGTNKVPFDVELFDTGAEYDPTTNYRFTATSTGYYFLSASATVTSAGSGAYGIRLKLNGTTYFDGCNGPTIAQTKTYTVSGVYSLTAGDYVEIWFYVNEASGTQTCYDAYAGTHDGSGFSGFRVA